MRKMLIIIVAVVLLTGVGSLIPATPLTATPSQAYLFACETGDLWTLLSCTLTALIMEGINYTWS